MNENLVPLSRVIKASIIDVGGDMGQKYQAHAHWAARSLKDISRQSLKSNKRKALLLVNHNTQTATLPCDVEEITFVGFLSGGKKVPLDTDNSLPDNLNIDVEEKILCKKCGQDTKICQDLVITETVYPISIGDTMYEQTVIKKLYPNGSYYLETSTPFYNLSTGLVEFPPVPEKKFITSIDLLDCGCPATTPENLCTLEKFCPEVFGCYYAGCGSCNVNYGGYRVFEESGLIQLDSRYRLDNIYIEYTGFLTKIKGRYYVPAVAFETIVELTKFKSMDGRSSVSNPDKRWRYEMYRTARGTMDQIIGRVSLRSIMRAADLVPDFSITYNEWQDCCCRNAAAALPAVVDDCAVAIAPEVITKTEVVYVNKTITEYISREVIYGKRLFEIGLDAPIAEGVTSYVIEQGGVPVTNIIPDSLNIVIDGVPIYEDTNDQISAVITYAPAGTSVEFNQGVINEQKYRFTYVKNI